MRTRGGLCLLLGLLLFAHSTCCSAAKDEKASADTPGAEEQSAVLQLNTDNIGDLIERQTAPALVAFIVETKCDTCQHLAHGLGKVAANLKGIANVGLIKCDRVDAVRTCRAYNAGAFPKVLVFQPGTKVNPYTGGSMKDFSDFTGAVSAKSLITAVTDTLDSTHLTAVGSKAQHEAFLQQDPKLGKVLLFTDKPASTVLAKGLSWAYARRLLFAEVRPTEAEGKALAVQYGVDKYPTLLLVKTDGSHEVYNGVLKAPELRTFLDSHAPKEPLIEGTGSDKAGLRDPLGQLAQVEVHSLDIGNLTDIDSKDDMWLIGFYATKGGETCSAQLDELHKLLVDVQGIVNYGTFDTTGVDAKVLEPYELDTQALTAHSCTPQLVLLPFGEFKTTKGGYRRWSGGLDDAKALQDWILKTVPDYTIPITGEMEAQFFLDATADTLPKPPKAKTYKERHAPIGKVLLFTNRPEVPSIYKALALQFVGKSRLLFAWVKVETDAGPGVALMQKMNVRKTPAMTILFPLPPKPLGADNEEVPDSTRDNMAIQQYMGPLKYQKMLAWLTAMSTLTGMSYKAHAGATKGPAPEHFEIIDQAQLQEACYDKPGLCLITLLDGRSETANQHRDTVKKSAATHAGQPVNWVVIDVSRQPSFRRAYGFTADQLPALVALSTKRMRFAQGPAPFSEDSAKQLVQKVLMGTAVTLPLPDLPQLVSGGEPDEEVLSAEEEFRLDEVMAEEVKELFRKEEKIKQAEEEMRQEALLKQQKKTKKKSSKKKGKKKAKQKGSGSSSKSKSVKDEL